MLEKYIQQFYEWGKWEGIMHNLLLILGIYVIYLFVAYPQNRTMPNILLATIAIAIDTLIHQNINIRNNIKPTYI
jgi:hypothetical protein